MRAARLTFSTSVVACLLLGTGPEAQAAEYGLTTYALGQNGFGAGITPPAGTYVSTLAGVYSGRIGGTLDFGGVTLGAGAHLDFFTSGINGLYVFDRKVLGGNLAVSATIPVGYMNLDAMVTVGPLVRSAEHRRRWSGRHRPQSAARLDARRLLAHRLHPDGDSDRSI